jgi:ABC-type uncharacterized transport system permease subunit
MRLKVEPRKDVGRFWIVMTPVLSVAVSVLAGLVLFAAMGYSPGAVLYQFFISPLTTLYGVSEVALKATPLILIAVGLAAGFRANVWNIGAEGQLTIGAICGGALALAIPDTPAFILLPAMALAGAAGGLAWASVPAALKVRFGVNEILTSLMLTYVATLFLGLLVHGPLKDPAGFGFPQSEMLSPSATMPLLVEGTRLHVGFLVALAVAVAGAFLMARMLIGFRIRVLGAAPSAARYAGFDADRIVWGTLLTSGALAGLAGVFEVAGPIGQLVPSVSPGYGFTAIIVAFLGRLHPLGIVAAAFMMALSYIGGENAQVAVNLPKAATGLFQGMLLFFLLASDFFLRYRVRLAPAQGAAA